MTTTIHLPMSSGGRTWRRHSGLHGVVADEETLLALPFLVELDDDVVAALDGE